MNNLKLILFAVLAAVSLAASPNTDTTVTSKPTTPASITNEPITTATVASTTAAPTTSPCTKFNAAGDCEDTTRPCPAGEEKNAAGECKPVANKPPTTKPCQAGEEMNAAGECKPVNNKPPPTKPCQAGEEMNAAGECKSVTKLPPTKPCQAGEEMNAAGECKPVKMCCRALTAECLSCAFNTGVIEFCKEHPGFVGCWKDHGNPTQDDHHHDDGASGGGNHDDDHHHFPGTSGSGGDNHDDHHHFPGTSGSGGGNHDDHHHFPGTSGASDSGPGNGPDDGPSGGSHDHHHAGDHHHGSHGATGSTHDDDHHYRPGLDDDHHRPGLDDDHPELCCTEASIECLACTKGVDPDVYVKDLDGDAVTTLIRWNPGLKVSKTNCSNLLDKLKANNKNGDFSKWSKDNINEAGTLLTGMSVDDMAAIPGGTFMDTIGTFGAVTDWLKEQAKTLADRFKDSLSHGISGATADVLRKAGSVLEGLTKEDIKSITDAAWEGAKIAFKELCKKKNALDGEQADAIKEHMRKNLPKPEDLTAETVRDMGGLLGFLDERELADLPAEVMDELPAEVIEVMGGDKVAGAWDADKLSRLSTKARNMLYGNDFEKFDKEQVKAILGKKAGRKLGAFVDFVRRHDKYFTADKMMAAIQKILDAKFGDGKFSVTKVQDSLPVAQDGTPTVDTTLRGGDKRRLTAAAASQAGAELESVVRVETNTAAEANSVAGAAASEGSPTVVPVDDTAENNNSTPMWVWAAVSGGCVALMAAAALTAFRMKGGKSKPGARNKNRRPSLLEAQAIEEGLPVADPNKLPTRM